MNEDRPEEPRDHAPPPAIERGTGDATRLGFSVDEFAIKAGISRSLAYDAARRGLIPVLRFGKRRIVIPKAALERFLAEVK